MSEAPGHLATKPLIRSCFYLKVNRVSGPPKPYAWAIYAEGCDAYMQQSTERFRTLTEAWDAGCRVMGRIS